MSSPNVSISESLSRFFTVARPNSGFDATDVINMKDGEAQKAGTFRQWNIFRRLGRSDAEVSANNDTRQQFLDGLKESFGLTETGKALVDRLADILGKDVFKPEDYSFKDGKLDSGRPLTTHRITDIYAVVASKAESARKVKHDKIAKSLIPITFELEHKFESSFDKAFKISAGPGFNDFVKSIKEDTLNAFSHDNNPEVVKRFKLHPKLLGYSAALRIAVDKNLGNIDNVDEKDKLVNDIITEMKKDPDFAELYEKREKMLDEWYATSLVRRDRNEVENSIVMFFANKPELDS